MAGKQRKARQGKGTNEGGTATTASSVSAATLASRRVDVIKARITQLRARDAEISERIERDRREQGEVHAALAEAEAELEVEVLAPVANGVDPTEWLPEELLMAILLHVVTAGVCGLVCRRWYAVCQDGRVKRRAWEGRWEGYSAGWRSPQFLVGHTDFVRALAVGPNNVVYSGGKDHTVRAWSAVHGAHLRTLTGHTARVSALAVGIDGTVYSGSDGPEGSIRIWSGTDGRSLGTLEGYQGHSVLALAIAHDGTLFSGGSDWAIRVWSGRELVRTLTGHTDCVRTLAIGSRGRLYSGSSDMSIRVWMVADGSQSHLATLGGHTGTVRSIVVGVDGTVYSGSDDATIRMWAADDGRLLRTLDGHTDIVKSLVVGADGTLFSGSFDATIRVWCCATGALRYTLPCMNSLIWAVAIGNDGKLYAHGTVSREIIVW
jgi:hypothetical protein